MRLVHKGLGPVGMYVARWCQLKGASRIIGIDAVPGRLAFAQEKLGIEVVNFKEHKDVAKRLLELVPGGLDMAVDCGSFHEPKSWLHKAQKLAMLETDSPETINEMIYSVRKKGKCGIIAAYAGYANGVNVGALMEKGVRYVSTVFSFSCFFLKKNRISQIDWERSGSCTLVLGRNHERLHSNWKIRSYIVGSRSVNVLCKTLMVIFPIAFSLIVSRLKTWTSSTLRLISGKRVWRRSL